jgi:hypothetical protein
MLVLVVAITAGYAFNKLDTNRNAKVSTIKGMYVFIKSEPVDDYTYLGTMEKKLNPTSFEKTIEQFITMARKDYPQADGIIFKGALNANGVFKADAIKFK